jgi:hypothetical protein
METGHGKGFSCFLGISETNTIWVASLADGFKIVDQKLITFEKGDCVLIPNGTLHAGDSNLSKAPRYKAFTEVYTSLIPSSKSLLWVTEGQGYTKQKQKY